MPFTKHISAKTITSAVLFCMLFTIFLVLGAFIKNLFPLRFQSLLYGILGTIIALALTAVFLKFHKKSFAQMGLVWQRNTIKKFATGFAIGFGIISAVILSLIGFAGLTITSNPSVSITHFFLAMVAFIPLAFMEELAFRGYPFIKLNQTIGIWGTQIIIALLFAGYHVAGGMPLLSALMGPGIWAFVFGVALLHSGGLALPTGMHVAANFTQALVGIKTDFPSLLTLDYKIPPDAAALQQTEMVGSIFQIIMLVVALFLTHRFSTRRVAMSI